MAAGQFFGEELYPIMSNTGILIFIITIEAVMVEVDKDIVAIENEASFLVCVALKGDEISVARPSSTTVEQRNDNNSMLHDEESPTIISDQADTDAAEVAGDGVDSSTNIAASNVQNDVVYNFQDEETPAATGVDGLEQRNDITPHDEEVPTIISDQADTDAAEVAGDGVDSSTNIAMISKMRRRQQPQESTGVHL
jgi:acid stress-induced BolA-like protein IbaG/YrbA